jgi:FMN phosphatase YigB (HAD superfamily)
MKIDYLLLDADGVVIDTKEYFSQKYARERNLHISVIDNFFQTHWYEIVCGKKDLKITLEPYLKSFRWNGSVDEYLDFWFNSESNKDEKLLDYVSNLKTKVSSINLATNQEKYRLDYFKSSLKLDKIFETIFASCELGFKKPDSEFYQNMWEMLGKPPKSSILFWDDTVTNVIEAKRFGFKAEVYTNFESFRQIMNNHYKL